MYVLVYPAVLLILAVAHLPRALQRWPGRCHWAICASYFSLAVWFIALFAFGVAEAH
jgi:hypothetical protein